MDWQSLAPMVDIRFGNHVVGVHQIDTRVMRLLQGIRDHGAILRAAKEQGCGYSYAWCAINDAEEALGFKLIERNGPHGSGLTAAGEEFLRRFELYEKRVVAYADQAFLRLFDDFDVN